MSGGGGGGETTTTNVTNTGLGDDQYQTLADNQVGISGQIDTARDDATARYDNFDSRFDGLDTSVSGIGTNLTSGFTNISDLMDTYNKGMNDQFSTVNTGVTANNTAIGGNATALGNLSTDVSGRFDTVDAGQENLQSTVDQGISDQAQGFSDAQADRTQQFDAANTATSNSFKAAGDALDAGLSDTSTQITDTQKNVLGGQGNLQDNLTTMADTVDIYAGQSLENQEAIQSGQDGFVTSFDNYVGRYSDDTTLANQTRADLQTAQATGFDVTRDAIGTAANLTAEGQQALSQQVNQNNSLLEGSMEGGFRQANQTSENLRDVLSNQIDTTSSGIMANQETMVNSQGELAQGQQDVANTVMDGQQGLANTFMNESGQIDNALINQTRDLAGIAATQTDLDMGMRQNFQQLSTSFDDRGQLIQNSVDGNGNTIMREMDNNGNLMLRAMDAQGRDVGSKIINVNQSVSDLGALQRTQGANMQMGNLSPASQTSETLSGFASPFTTTR